VIGTKTGTGTLLIDRTRMSGRVYSNYAGRW
jgi:hypothetical protein